jgi:hypothetical protein
MIPKKPMKNPTIPRTNDAIAMPFQSFPAVGDTICSWYPE